MWSFSVSELAIPGAEIGRISATDADLGENAKLEYTILEGESGDTFNITGVNQEAVITLNKVRERWQGRRAGQMEGGIKKVCVRGEGEERRVVWMPWERGQLDKGGLWEGV